MPYATTADLPQAVRDKFKDQPTKLRQWLHVFNAQNAAGKTDAVSMASAWAAVGKAFIPGEDQTFALVDLDFSEVRKLHDSLEDVEEVGKLHSGKVAGEILKINEAEQIVYGWASIWSVNGERIVDKQNDRLDPANMEKRITEFMQGPRVLKAMHEGEQVGQVVHSLPLTKQLAGLLGVYSPIEGWITGTHVRDSKTWKRVTSGELRAFSIGGEGRRA